MRWPVPDTGAAAGAISIALPAGTYAGQVVAITGGGTGIGKATASLMARLGATPKYQRPICTGPIAVKELSGLHKDIANLQAACAAAAAPGQAPLVVVEDPHPGDGRHFVLGGRAPAMVQRVTRLLLEGRGE